ncbi:MAG: hypothetical protein ACYTAF_06260, partial [Planctomycetota bacterium]
MPAPVRATASRLPHRFRGADGQFRAAGDGFLVAADAGGLALLPWSDEGTSDPAFLYRLESVRAGDGVLYRRTAADAAHPKAFLDTVAYERTPLLTEIYENLPAGVEQSFLIARRPAGNGDLMIEGTVQTTAPLVQSPDGDREPLLRTRKGLVFVDGARGCTTTVGQVTVLDAAGRTGTAWIEVSALHEGEDSHLYAIAYRVPGAWLEQASYPLLVDPLIGVNFKVNQTSVGGQQLNPAIAYDSANDRYFVAFEDRVSNNDRDVVGQIVNGDGTIDTGTFPETVICNDDLMDFYLDVDFRSAPGQGEFLVTWVDGDTSKRNLTERIIARRVDTAGGTTLGASFEISPSERESQTYTVASYNALTDSFLVVWEDDDGVHGNIKGRRVAGGATATLDLADLVFSSTGDYGTTGGCLCAATADPEIAEGRWLVVFSKNFTGSDRIQGRLVNATTGAVIGSDPFDITTIAAGPNYEPRVAYGSANDEYMVVFDAIDQVRARRVSNDGIPRGEDGEGGFLVADEGAAGVDRCAIAYDPLANAFLAVWETDRNGTGSRVVSGAKILADGTVPEPAFDLISDSGLNGARGARSAFNSNLGEFLTVAHDDRSGDFDVWAQRCSLEAIPFFDFTFAAGSLAPGAVDPGSVVSFQLDITADPANEGTVTFTTASSLSFTDGTSAFTANLSADTAVAAGATVTLVFDATAVDAQFLGGAFQPSLTLVEAEGTFTPEVNDLVSVSPVVDVVLFNPQGVALGDEGVVWTLTAANTSADTGVSLTTGS